MSKPTRVCPYCGGEFVPRWQMRSKTCGESECRKAHAKELALRYYQRLEIKEAKAERARRRNQRPEVKAANVERLRLRRQKPGAREAEAKSERRRRQRPEVKAHVQEYRQKPEVKERERLQHQMRGRRRRAAAKTRAFLNLKEDLKHGASPDATQ